MLTNKFHEELAACRIRCSEIKGEPAKQAEDIRGDGYAVASAD